MATASEMVTKIDTAIENIITGEVDTVTIEGESYNNLDLDKLRRMRDHYASIGGVDDAITAGSAPFGITGLSAGSGK